MRNKIICFIVLIILGLTVNAQITWEKLIIPDSVIRPNGIVEIDEGVLVLSSGQGILKSVDNGDNWYGVSDIAAYDIVYNPRNEILYTGNQISYDLGETWTETGAYFSYNITVLLNNDLIMSTTNLIIRRSSDGLQYDTLYNPMETELRFCKVVEDADGYLYTGTYAYMGGGGVYRSDDYGESWNIISWDSVYVLDLAIGPDNVLYAARYGGYNEINPGLYKSIDHGLSWEKIHDGYLSAQTVLVLPNNTIFGGISSYGAYGGVYQINPNETSGFVNNGLDQDDVENLYLSPSGILFVKSIAHGTDKHYEFYRTTEPVYVGQNEIDTRESDIIIYPNPAKSYFRIESNNKIEAVRIFSIYGEQILLEKQNFNNDYTVDLNNIIPGNYIVQIVTNSDVYSEKLIIY